MGGDTSCEDFGLGKPRASSPLKGPSATWRELTGDETRQALSSYLAARVDPELGKPYPRILGRCPSCQSSNLFRGHGGYVTCGLIGCKDPGAAHDLLMSGRA